MQGAVSYPQVSLGSPRTGDISVSGAMFYKLQPLVGNFPTHEEKQALQYPPTARRVFPLDICVGASQRKNPSHSLA